MIYHHNHITLLAISAKSMKTLQTILNHCFLYLFYNCLLFNQYETLSCKVIPNVILFFYPQATGISL